jgi:hypothetical protein
MKKLQEKLMNLDQALAEIQIKLDEVTNPWDAENLEKMYTKLWREYHMILKQIEGCN